MNFDFFEKKMSTSNEDKSEPKNFISRDLSCGNFVVRFVFFTVFTSGHWLYRSCTLYKLCRKIFHFSSFWVSTGLIFIGNSWDSDAFTCTFPNFTQRQLDLLALDCAFCSDNLEVFLLLIRKYYLLSGWFMEFSQLLRLLVSSLYWQFMKREISQLSKLCKNCKPITIAKV